MKIAEIPAGDRRILSLLLVLGLLLGETPASAMYPPM